MWYYSVDGQTLGPLSEAELDQQVKSGTLPATVYIWRDGMAEWQPYNEVRKPSGPGPLRVVMPVAVPVAAASVYAEPEVEAEPEVQGSTRLESISSWGMVSVVLVAMFVFIGLLASRSHAETRRYGGSYGGSANGGKSLRASLKLRQGSLSVSNGATFDWPLTMILLKSGAETYSYKLPSLPQQEAIAISLEDFATTDGDKFSAVSGPMDVTIISPGYAVSRTRFSKR
jgi:hypothetical protein